MKNATSRESKSSDKKYNQSVSETVSSENDGKIVIKQCNLRRTRFINTRMAGTKSRVGGGKLFRQSHVKGPAHEKGRSTAKSWLRVNQSLSDIESIDSNEHGEESESVLSHEDEEEEMSDVGDESKSKDQIDDSTLQINHNMRLED